MKRNRKKKITGKVVASSVLLLLLPARVWCLPAPVSIPGGARWRVWVPPEGEGPKVEGENVVKREKIFLFE